VEISCFQEFFPTSTILKIKSQKFALKIENSETLAFTMVSFNVLFRNFEHHIDLYAVVRKKHFVKKFL